MLSGYGKSLQMKCVEEGGRALGLGFRGDIAKLVRSTPNSDAFPDMPSRVCCLLFSSYCLCLYINFFNRFFCTI